MFVLSLQAKIVGMRKENIGNIYGIFTDTPIELCYSRHS